MYTEPGLTWSEIFSDGRNIKVRNSERAKESAQEIIVGWERICCVAVKEGSGGCVFRNVVPKYSTSLLFSLICLYHINLPGHLLPAYINKYREQPLFPHGKTFAPHL